MSNSNNSKPNITNFIENDELDLKIIFNAIFRNKNLIFSVSLGFLFLSFLFSFTRKKIYEGSFQIVIEKKQDPSLSSSLMNLVPGNFPFLNSGNSGKSSLITEVAILKSPLVLRPTFNRIILERKNKNLPTRNFNFQKLRGNLKVELIKKTSILNVKFNDSEKDIILPVLSNISAAYQDYSSRNKKRGIELSKKYLIEQIKLYKIKSEESIKNVQEYGFDKDLTVLQIGRQFNTENNIPKFKLGTSENKNISSTSTDLNTITNIELVRAITASELKSNNKILQQIKELNYDETLVQFIRNEIPQSQKNNLSKKLQELDLAILELKTKYKSNNQFLKKAEEKKINLLKLLKKELIGSLNARNISLESKLESVIKPKEVILKYKQLYRNSERDEKTLMSLENQLNILKLEESRIEDPWELISEPELKNNPIKPDKKVITFTGFLIGLLSSGILVLIKEKRSNYFFEPTIISNYLNIPIKLKVDIKENSDLTSSELLNDLITQNSSNKLNLITPKNTDADLLNVLKKIVNNKKYKTELLSLNTELNNIQSSDNSYLIINLKKASKKEIEFLKQRLNILEININGLILID